MKLLPAIIAIFLFLPNSKAQEYYTNFQEYGTRDGFHSFEASGNVVRDKKGFLWIGSDNGLYRFDGQNFKVFRHNPNDPHSLPSDNARVIMIDHEGNFWINNGVKGLSVFDPVSQKFHPWRNSNRSSIDISNENIKKIYQDSSGTIWLIIGGKGIASLNKHDSLVTLFSFFDQRDVQPGWMSAANLNDIAEDRDHQLWIASQSGLVHFNSVTKNFKIFRDTTHGKENESRHTALNNIFIAGDGTLWIGSWGAGVKKFDPKNNSWETYCWDLQHLENSTRNIAHCILQKSANELWVATLSGLLIFNTHTKQFSKLVNIDAASTATITATNLFDDGLGNIWCSGLKPLDKLETKNNSFHFQLVADNSLFGSGLSVCNNFLQYPFDSLLLIGTYHSKGMHILDRRTATVTNYPLIKKKIFHENINQFLVDSKKNIWICYNTGVRLFDISTKQYRAIDPSIKRPVTWQIQQYMPQLKMTMAASGLPPGRTVSCNIIRNEKRYAHLFMAITKHPTIISSHFLKTAKEISGWDTMESLVSLVSAGTAEM